MRGQGRPSRAVEVESDSRSGVSERVASTTAVNMPYVLVRTRRNVLCGRVRASGCSPTQHTHSYCWGVRATTIRQRIDHVGFNFELILEFLLFILVKPLFRNLRGEDVGPEVKWSREQPVLISARQLYLLFASLLIILLHFSSCCLFPAIIYSPTPTDHITTGADALTDYSTSSIKAAPKNGDQWFLSQSHFENF